MGSSKVRTIGAALVAVAALLIAPGVSAVDPDPAVATFDFTDNLDPLGSAPRASVSSSDFNTDLAFWGTHAYQGAYDGFRIIDISQPEDPTQVSFTQCGGSQGDVIVWDDVLVRSWNSAAGSTATCDGAPVTQGFEGLHIFDISDPADPVRLAEVNLPCGSHTATGVPDLANGRLLVYNSASSSGNDTDPLTPNCGGISLVEVPLATPATAAMLSHTLAGRACHDTAVILGPAPKAACAGGNGVTVFSLGGGTPLASLTNPVLLYTTSFAADSVSIGHAVTFSWDGEILVFGHEPGGGSAAECEASDVDSKKTVWFLDATTGAELGRWVLPVAQGPTENCTIHNFNTVPSAMDRVLVSGNYQAGIWVIDFNDPANPVEIAHADPAALDPDTLILGGDWSTYWYNGILYESDIKRGLLTWRLNDYRVADHQLLEHSNPQTQEFVIPFEGPSEPPEPEPTPTPTPTLTPMGGGSGGEDTPTCKGHDVTILGTGGDDTLVGTPGPDVFLAKGGDDTVLGRGGKDVVCAGPGDDEIKGQGGNDLLKGQAGDDLLAGGGGNDVLIGAAGSDDLCKGGKGVDKGRRCERGSYEKGK